MKILLFGSYSTGTSNSKSDVDVLITDDDMNGFFNFPDGLDTLVDEFEKYSLEKGGVLDLFLDRREFFESPYSDRMLFGDDFFSDLEEKEKYMRDMTSGELKELLSINDHEGKVRWINANLLNRSELVE